MRKLLLMLIFSFGVVAQPAHAAIDVYVFDDPVKDERFKAMSEELRCLVCQNQNIADSNAELAQDLKREIYEMITTGLTERKLSISWSSDTATSYSIGPRLRVLRLFSGRVHLSSVYWAWHF